MRVSSAACPGLTAIGILLMLVSEPIKQTERTFQLPCACPERGGVLCVAEFLVAADRSQDLLPLTRIELAPVELEVAVDLRYQLTEPCPQFYVQPVEGLGADGEGVGVDGEGALRFPRSLVSAREVVAQALVLLV